MYMAVNSGRTVFSRDNATFVETFITHVRSLLQNASGVGHQSLYDFTPCRKESVQRKFTKKPR
jgi:hypothetical protein